MEYPGQKPNWLVKELFPLKRVDRYLSWVLGLCALLLYLALPVRVIGYDSLAYAVETTSTLIQRHFNPHHLLFSRTQFLFLSVIRLFDGGANPLNTMVWFNSILGSFLLVFFYRCLYLVSGRRLVSSLITIVLGTSWVFYGFASSGDTAIPADFLIVLALYLSLSRKKDTFRHSALVAVIAGLALLYHQISIFYLPIIAITELRTCPRDKLLSRGLVFLMLSLGLAALVYLIVMVLYYQLSSLEAWWAFLTAAARHDGVWGSYNPWAYLTGLEYWLNSGTYAFSIANAQGDELAWMIVSRSLCWALLGLVVVMMIVRAFKREWLGVVYGAVMLIAMTFIDWWEAPTTDFWVILWALLLLLLSWAGRGRLQQLLAVWLLFYIPAQFTVNWYYKLADVTAPDADLKGRIIGRMVGCVQPGSAILLTDDANLALRSEMAGIHAILFSRMNDANRRAIASFISLYSNSETRNLRFIASDNLCRSFSSNIELFLPVQYTQSVAAAFANATPLVEVTDRYGRKLAILTLGGSK
jgi:hypothetical protein